jgi:hypothetical protein
MGPAVYIVGALTTCICALLLLRGFFHSRQRLLLWSGLCFVGLAISNSLIFVDLVLFPDVDLYRVRLATAAVAMILLLYGLIWGSD